MGWSLDLKDVLFPDDDDDDDDKDNDDDGMNCDIMDY